ncbi:MAG: ribose 5-phosphate isomerase B [Candidatus Muiribacteriota bacterium]
MKIAIGSDHAGFELKKHFLESFENVQFLDEGCFSKESVDYPDYAKNVSDKVNSGEADLGFLICGTGIGMSISANKHKNIRAACCTNILMAEMTRRHNNANVLTIGSRIIGVELAERIFKVFIKTEFEGGRHKKRISKIE